MWRRPVGSARALGDAVAKKDAGQIAHAGLFVATLLRHRPEINHVVGDEREQLRQLQQIPINGNPRFDNMLVAERHRDRLGAIELAESEQIHGLTGGDLNQARQMRLAFAKRWARLGVEPDQMLVADGLPGGGEVGGGLDQPDRAAVADDGQLHQFLVADLTRFTGWLRSRLMRHRSTYFIAAIIVSPISAGVLAMAMPQDSSAAILSAAVPEPPLMIAPACPIRRPFGAVTPAMNAATGLVKLSLIQRAASSSAEPPISPMRITASVCGSVSKISSRSMKSSPLTG